jgi:MOSC domain-containing protein YiiM
MILPAGRYQSSIAVTGDRFVEILKELLGGSTAVGTVRWLGIATASRAVIQPQQTVQIVRGGIEGDHHCRPQRASKRQVTLIQAEHLQVVADLLNCGEIDPSELRRNIVVSGICLESLRYQQFRIGTAILSGSGSCPPCSRMEENLGPGGYAAMLGHGGITAVVIQSGSISLGDSVQPLGPLPAST